MIAEIEDFYETHCIDYDWVVFQSLDEEAFSIDVLIEYPLSKSSRQIVVVLSKKRGILSRIKKDLIFLIGEEIRKGANRYDSEYQNNNRY
jgi:hypothetical protein